MTAGKIKILVVDDSAVVRGMLSKLINAEPDMEFVGSANDGKAGIDKAMSLRPDVIVLDIDMPVMGGLEALSILRTKLPNTPVIIFSTLTADGATVTIEALANGAADYATKPSGTGSSFAAADQVRADLLTKIRALLPQRTMSAPTPAAAPIATRPRVGQSVDAVIIGSSTGGPAALEAVLPKIPLLHVPILMVQHMPPTFTGVLAERLDKMCPFPVTEATEGIKVEPGHCYLAPGGLHMRLNRTDKGVHITLDEGPKIKSCRPSVDALFDSAAEAYGGRMVATILTGMGDDGLDSCRRLTQLDVEIIVQDEATSVVWGMPGAVAKAGLASRCLPLDEIAKAITDIAARPVRNRGASEVLSRS